MTCHSSNYFSIVWGQGNAPIGDSSSEQLLYDFSSQSSALLVLYLTVFTLRLISKQN